MMLKCKCCKKYATINEKEFWDHLITNHKEEFVKELDLNINSLCGYQAEKFVEQLIKGGISKRMIKGKVRNKIKNFFNRIDEFYL